MGSHDHPSLESLEFRRFLSAGGIDPYFATNGAAVFDGGRVLVMHDGRIIGVNRVYTYDADDHEHISLKMQRFSAGGVPDADFHVTLAAPSSLVEQESASVAAALDASDRLFVTVGGRIYCILPSGKLDSSFGSKGAVNTPLAGQINDIFVQRDGKLVVSGTQAIRQTYDDEVTVLHAAGLCRITAAGKRDTTFGPKGMRYLTDFEEDLYNVYDLSAQRTTQASDGKLLVSLHNSYYDDDLYYYRSESTDSILRRRLDGSPDPSLASIEGQTKFSSYYYSPSDPYPYAARTKSADEQYLGNYLTPQAFAIDGRDRIVQLIQDADSSDPRHGGIMRLNSDGSLDTSFATDGFLDSFFSDDRHPDLDSLLVLSSGKILIAAHLPAHIENTDSSFEQLLIQLNDNGTLDSSFGNSGVLSLGADRHINQLALNTDGSILTVESQDSTQRLRRLWRDEAPAASLSVRNVTTASTRPLALDVTYRDDGSIDLNTLNNRDLRVSGPGGFVVYARFLGVVASQNDDGLIVARYRLGAPGGSWDVSDNGLFSVRLMNNQVSDTDGNATQGRTLGQFLVRVRGGTTTQALTKSVRASVAQDRFDDNSPAAIDELL